MAQVKLFQPRPEKVWASWLCLCVRWLERLADVALLPPASCPSSKPLLCVSCWISSPGSGGRDIQGGDDCMGSHGLPWAGPDQGAHLSAIRPCYYYLTLLIYGLSRCLRHGPCLGSQRAIWGRTWTGQDKTRADERRGEKRADRDSMAPSSERSDASLLGSLAMSPTTDRTMLPK